MVVVGLQGWRWSLQRWAMEDCVDGVACVCVEWRMIKGSWGCVLCPTHRVGGVGDKNSRGCLCVCRGVAFTKVASDSQNTDEIGAQTPPTIGTHSSRMRVWPCCMHVDRAGKVLPGCQDTGTGIVMGKRGQYVWTDGNDEEALSKGIFKAYTETNLRYSQVAPLDMFSEKNTGSNLPAQIELYATPGNKYEFMFMAKGGGSANKTMLYQQVRVRVGGGDEAAVGNSRGSAGVLWGAQCALSL